MEPINVTALSALTHNAQILTGFQMLRTQGWDIRFDKGGKPPFPEAAMVRVSYRGKTLLYDLWDGYQNPAFMRLELDQADFYFKRSFSREKNQLLFPQDCHKIYPLGFNYHVTFPGTSFSEPLWKATAKQFLGRVPNRYFTPDKFEGTATHLCGAARILFLTRLWDEEEPGLSDLLKQERRQINQMRIGIIRTLGQYFGPQFTGGLNDSPLSRALAPDLILPDTLTNRKQYLRLLHGSDICIATTGLHESIGWKTGEYVAAAKAIVSEPLCYELPGDFRCGTHYLSFSTPEECAATVQTLLDDPDRLLAMKQANEAYYHHYLRPDVLVRNTLAIAEQQTN